MYHKAFTCYCIYHKKNFVKNNVTGSDEIQSVLKQLIQMFARNIHTDRVHPVSEGGL